MATGVDIGSSHQETGGEMGPSGSTANGQYFCHECDKKFSCDNKNEVDDVSDSFKPPMNVNIKCKL